MNTSPSIINNEKTDKELAEDKSLISSLISLNLKKDENN